MRLIQSNLSVEILKMRLRLKLKIIATLMLHIGVQWVVCGERYDYEMPEIARTDENDENPALWINPEVTLFSCQNATYYMRN